MSKGLRRILMVCFLILTGVFAALFWFSRPEANAENRKVYKVVAFPGEKGDIEAMKKYAQEKELQFEVKPLTRQKKVKIGYRLVFYYDDQVALANMKDRLDKKKVESRIIKHEETGKLLIQGYGNFATEKQAESKIESLRELTAWRFAPEENFKKTPEKVQAMVIRTVPGNKLDNLLQHFRELGTEDFETVQIQESQE